MRLVASATRILRRRGLALLRRDDYRVARRAMFIAMALAFVLFVFDPTAPPRLVHGLGIRDSVGMSGHDVGSLHGIAYTPYAAMPSLHVGWSLIVGRAIVRTVHPIVMTIATGNHDVLEARARGGACRRAACARDREITHPR